MFFIALQLIGQNSISDPRLCNRVDSITNNDNSKLCYSETIVEFSCSDFGSSDFARIVTPVARPRFDTCCKEFAYGDFAYSDIRLQ